jgi:ATP-dependent DNA helicase RecQ
MGIDKPGVRVVVHYGAPKTLEGYYQQTGRAGRDGKFSRCVLLYGHSDLAMSSNKEEDELQGLVRRFCCSSQCRRKELLEYFGEKPSSPTCGSCDVCDRKTAKERSSSAVQSKAAASSEATSSAGVISVSAQGGSSLKDLTDEARLLLTAVQLTGQRYGIGTPIAVLQGSQAKDLLRKFSLCKLQVCSPPPPPLYAHTHTHTPISACVSLLHIAIFTTKY